MRDEGPTQPQSDDEQALASSATIDRAAILARRQRFIALALGMVGATGCPVHAPQPCLQVPAQPDGAPPRAPEERDSSSATPSSDAPTTAPPSEPPTATRANEVAPPMATPTPCLNIITTSKILFAAEFGEGGSELQAEAEDALALVVELLEQRPDVELDIGGHSDDTGPEKRNVELSRLRAAAVRDYLVRAGIAGERLRIHAYGSTRPIASNATDEGRRRNRRVEFELVR